MAARRKREVALRCLAQLAWRFYVFRRIAPTLSKNVILAFPYTFLIHHCKLRYLQRSATSLSLRAAAAAARMGRPTNSRRGLIAYWVRPFLF